MSSRPKRQAKKAKKYDDEGGACVLQPAVSTMPLVLYA